MNTIKTGKGSTTKGFLDRFFNLSNNGTNVRTEFFAGITMFIASVYILAVIPNLLNWYGYYYGACYGIRDYKSTAVFVRYF